MAIFVRISDRQFLPYSYNISRQLVGIWAGISMGCNFKVTFCKMCGRVVFGLSHDRFVSSCMPQWKWC